MDAPSCSSCAITVLLPQSSQNGDGNTNNGMLRKSDGILEPITETGNLTTVNEAPKRYQEATLDWTIPDFSFYVNRKTEMFSDELAIGTYTWTLVLTPLHEVTNIRWKKSYKWVKLWLKCSRTDNAPIQLSVKASFNVIRPSSELNRLDPLSSSIV